MTQQAKRIKDGLSENSDLDDSQICYWKNDVDGVWMLYLPSCGIGSLKLHTVTENADGTITVSPSILMEGSRGIVKHGYLENGIWRDA